jgi:spore coat protein U-like protein
VRIDWLVAALLACTCGAAQAACTVSLGNLSFGPYDPLSSAPATTSGNAVVTCNDAPPPTVQIQLSPSSVSGGFFPRRMRNAVGSDTLDYNFYADVGATQVWGDGTAGTTTRSQKVNKNNPWSVTFYGRIAVNQDVTPGSYSDALTITIAF